MLDSTFFKRTMLATGLACVLTSWSFAGDDKPSSVAEIILPTANGPDGRAVVMTAPRGGLSALIFYSSECPISNAYSPLLNRLRSEFPADKVNLVGLCVDPDLSDADMIAHAKDFGLKFPIVHDRKGAFAAKLGATVTPEAFVVDGAQRHHHITEVQPGGAYLHADLARGQGARRVAGPQGQIA